MIWALGLKRSARWMAISVTPVIVAAACSGANEQSSAGESEPDRPVAQAQRFGVVGEFEAEFDGTNFRITPVGAAVKADGAEQVGSSSQALLPKLDAGSYATGITSTATDEISLEQISRITVQPSGSSADPPGTTWDTVHCGPQPTAGVCARIRMRNRFTNQKQLARAFVEVTSLTPQSPTTAVSIPTVANVTSTTDGDFGISSMLGLWHYGAVGRMSPADTGTDSYWTVVGSTPTSLHFRMRSIVKGMFVDPTVRVDTKSPETDLPSITSPARGDNSYAGGGTPSTTVGLSTSGRYVVFASTATGLITPNPGGAPVRIYRKDLQTGEITYASRFSNGSIPTNCGSDSPAISGDGTVVVFRSLCKLVPADTDTAYDIYAFDYTTSTVTLLSAGTGGNSKSPAISPNGRYVAFDSVRDLDPTSAPPAGYAYSNIYLYDRNSAGIVRASRPTSSPNTWGNNNSTRPMVADNGVVVYSSLATNLVAGDTNGKEDVFVYDPSQRGSAGETTMMSVRSGGVGLLNNASNYAAVSGDGSVVAFTSLATNVFSSSSGGGFSQIYVRQRNSNAITRVTNSVTGSWGNGPSYRPAISADGRYLTYTSSATNMVSNGVSNYNIYIVDLKTSDPYLKLPFLISATESPLGTWVNQNATNMGITTLGISGDGTYVAYFQQPSTPGDLGTTARVFRSPITDLRAQRP